MRTSRLRTSLLVRLVARAPFWGLLLCLVAGGLTLPASSAHAAEFTDILDAADDKDDYDEDTYDPFDFNLEAGFSFDTTTAKITRENPCVPIEPRNVDQNTPGHDNPRVQFNPQQCDEVTVIENSEMAYRHQEATLDLTMRVGMYKDLELRINAPFVVNSRHGLKYDQGVGPGRSSVDPSDDRIERHATDNSGETGGSPGVFDPDGSDGSHVGRLGRFQQHRFFELSDQFKDIDRSGFADPSVGVHWAPYNDQRDDTKATLTLGMDYVMPIAETRRADNDAVGDGLHKLKWDVRSSKQFDFVEPYFGLNYTLQLLSRDSPITDLKEIDDQNAGQTLTQPPHEGRITVGTEFIPYENEETHERYAIDLQFSFGYTSEGRDYNPLYNHMADNRCNGKSLSDVLPEFNGDELANPEDVGCSWIAQRPANTDPPTYDLGQAWSDGRRNVQFQNNGIMTVESYASFAGKLGFYVQPTEYFQIKGLLGLTHQQQHYLTNGRTGRDGTDSNEKVDLSGSNAKFERNPVYNPNYDSPGNRFRVKKHNTWSFMLNTALQF